MNTTAVQRWREHRASYRPAGEPFNPRRFDVALFDEDRVARDFVAAHHYLGSLPPTRFRAGLYEAGALVGVAAFTVPQRDAVLAPYPRATAVELGRFVLLDQVRANAESWFLARAFELLRPEGIEGVVSFSDPLRRVAVDGTVRCRGHVGTVYAATNAIYVGPTRPETVRLLPDGRDLGLRALAKIRAKDTGWRYAVDALLAQGAPAPTSTSREALAAWVDRVVPRLTRRVRHPGKHKYFLPLKRTGAGCRAIVRALEARAVPYPKVIAPCSS